MSAPSSQRIHLTLSSQAARYASPETPVAKRRMASRGALPLEAHDLAHVLFALAHDKDIDVSFTARKTLQNLPQEVLTPLLTGPVHPALIAFLAQVHQENEEICQSLALHPNTEDNTLAFLASLPHRHVVDVISQNQIRLIRGEAIVDALGRNPLTGRAVVERILSLFEVAGEEQADDWSDTDWSREERTQAVLAALGCDQPELARAMTSEQDVEEEATKLNLFASVQSMSVMQKIKLARIGGKEARGLLIKDRNKVVACAVLASPKITEAEVTTIAQSRIVAEEILRIIATQRDWTRSYSVKLALCTNPKTPRPQAVKFMNYLRDKDLRSLMKSRDVPSVISSHARRILGKKGKI